MSLKLSEPAHMRAQIGQQQGRGGSGNPGYGYVLPPSGKVLPHYGKVQHLSGNGFFSGEDLFPECMGTGVSALGRVQGQAPTLTHCRKYVEQGMGAAGKGLTSGQGSI